MDNMLFLRDVLVSSLHRAPFEVLTWIFELAMPCYDSVELMKPPSLHEAPLNVSHVSRYWRNIALASPRLWTRIYFSDVPTLERISQELSFWHTSMQRAANMLLDVHIDMLNGDAKDASVDLREAAQIIGRKQMLWGQLIRDRQRWRNVFLEVTIDALLPHLRTATKETRQILLDGLHAAQEMELRLFHSSEELFCSSEVFVDLAQTPNLRHFGVGCVGSPVTLQLSFAETGSYHNLATLSLMSKTPMEADSLLRILAKLPRLEEFHASITHLTFSQRQRTTSFSPSIRLATLKVASITLYYSGSAPEASAANIRILQQLTFPALEKLTLNIGASRFYSLADSTELANTLLDFILRSTPPLRYLALGARVVEQTLINILGKLPMLEELQTVKVSSAFLVAIHIDKSDETHIEAIVSPRCLLLRRLSIEADLLENESVIRSLESRAHYYASQQHGAAWSLKGGEATLSVTLKYGDTNKAYDMIRFLRPHLQQSLRQTGLIVNVDF